MKCPHTTYHLEDVNLVNGVLNSSLIHKCRISIKYIFQSYFSMQITEFLSINLIFQEKITLFMCHVQRLIISALSIYSWLLFLHRAKP